MREDIAHCFCNEPFFTFITAKYLRMLSMQRHPSFSNKSLHINNSTTIHVLFPTAKRKCIPHSFIILKFCFPFFCYWITISILSTELTQSAKLHFFNSIQVIKSQNIDSEVQTFFDPSIAYFKY